MLSVVSRRATQARVATCQQLRFAGGGGRPGGKPTFNWKERMELRLARKGDKRIKPFKVGPSGDWDDIAPYFDKNKGHTMIDITDLDTFEAPETEELGEFEGENDTRKVIDVTSLFGPDKARGSLPKKRNHAKLNFSHRRIFGGNSSS